MGRLVIKGFPVGMLSTNCYIVMDGDTREGFIIDPGGDAKKVLATSRDMGLICLGILCTHGHMDHVGAAGKVAEATGARVRISSEDSGSLTGAGLKGMHDRLGSLLVSKPSGVEEIRPGDTLSFGEHRLEVKRTPGHTKGSLSFLVEDSLFDGDLVFEGSIGRTDLRGGSLKELVASVRDEVFTLPDDTRIFPGHGPATTVGEERYRNPFLNDIGRGD